MDAAAVDAAVDIVHSLPRGGPVQTTYEEKLWLYSLYKQSTEGDIAISRPGILDMLGRAKWDSWHKQKGKEKDTAKRQYVEALLNILRKYGRTAVSKSLIAELSAYDPTFLTTSAHAGPSRRSQSRTRTRPRPRSRSADSSSSSSSGGSFHSSQASPPRFPTPPPARSQAGSGVSGQAYPPPDPDMPIPDIAPDIVPPSALNASHKSLLSLANAGAADEPGRGETGMQYQVQRMSELAQSHAASRAHSLVEGHTGMGYTNGRGSPSVHSQRSGISRPGVQAASALGFAPIHSHAHHPLQPSTHFQPPVAGVYRHHLNPDPNVIARDYNISTPVLGPDASPYITYRAPYDPARPGTPSTFTVPPINVPATLQQISTSLAALHERMSTLERTQGLILRREERRKGTWLGAILGFGLGGLIGGKGEEEDLDEAEEAAERERARIREGRGNGEGATQGAGALQSVFASKVKKGRSRLALVWWLLRVIRRLVVDVSIGTMVAVGVVLLMRTWRMQYVRRMRVRLNAAMGRYLDKL